METSESFYDVLGVTEDAAPDDIKRAYFRLVRKFRPDENPDEFNRFKEAYTQLSDDKKRSEYDQMRRYGDKVQTLCDQASALLDSDPRKAVRLLREAVVIAPNMNLPRLYLGGAYIKARDYTAAEREFRRLVDQVPDDAFVRVQYARSLWLQDLNDSAEVDLLKAIELDPYCYDAYLLLARIYQENLDTARAIETLDKVIRLDGTEDIGDMDTFVEMMRIYALDEDEDGLDRTVGRIHHAVGDDADCANYAMSSLLDLAIYLHKSENFAAANAVIDRVNDDLLSDNELKNTINKAQEIFGRDVEILRMCDDHFNNDIGVYLLWKYLDPEDKIEKDTVEACIEDLYSDVRQNPSQWSTRLSELRRRYPYVAQAEDDFLTDLYKLTSPPIGSAVRVAEKSMPPTSARSTPIQPVKEAETGNVAFGCIIMIICAVVAQVIIPIPILGFVIGAVIGVVVSIQIKAFT